MQLEAVAVVLVLEVLEVLVVLVVELVVTTLHLELVLLAKVTMAGQATLVVREVLLVLVEVVVLGLLVHLEQLWLVALEETE
jgi:hypothetical protein